MATPATDPKGEGRMERTLRLMLCGDVMTGRGIDQIMAQSVDPALFEPVVRSAKEYITLAEKRHGAIPRNVKPGYIWGDALAIMEEFKPDVRIANLETAVTTSDDRQPKGINYRMHPANVSCLQAAELDVCTLANNHVLDWGKQGLRETLDVLQNAGIQTAGAGLDLNAAKAPAIQQTGEGRVLVFAGGHPGSGIEPGWAATASRPGVRLLRDFSSSTVASIAQTIQAQRREGDVVVYSIHWGGNWGYDISEEHQAFARMLIDEAGVDLVFGHSSHHPRGMEVYNKKLILYGCGDLINDYEGITGYEQFRPDLRVLYFPLLNQHGDLKGLDVAVLNSARFSLQRPAREDVGWLRERLAEASKEGGVGVRSRADNLFAIHW